MTARTSYEFSVKTAPATGAVTLADEVSRQTTIDAQLSVAGYTLQTGTYSTLKAAYDSAAKTALANGIAREQSKQAALALARDVLRDTGDRGAF